MASITYDDTFLRQLERELRAGCEEIVQSLAEEIAASAADEAPVLTGALKASLYANGPKRSGYDAAVSRMQALRRDVAPVAEQARPLADFEDVVVAVVSSTAPYAGFVHD